MESSGIPVVTDLIMARISLEVTYFRISLENSCLPPREFDISASPSPQVSLPLWENSEYIMMARPASREGAQLAHAWLLRWSQVLAG